MYFIDNHDISKYECYKKTGMTHGILSQPNGISEDNLLKFINYYDYVSLDWLLRGKGNMIACEGKEKSEIVIKIRELQDEIKSKSDSIGDLEKQKKELQKKLK